MGMSIGMYVTPGNIFFFYPICIAISLQWSTASQLDLWVLIVLTSWQELQTWETREKFQTDSNVSTIIIMEAHENEREM